ncbi:MAG: hypothetical protein ACK5LY_07750 [Lachnospirales bacterium]
MKKNLKKVLIGFTMATLMFALASCGSTADTQTETTETTEAETTETETTEAETTEAETTTEETVVEDVVEESTESAESATSTPGLYETSTLTLNYDPTFEFIPGIETEEVTMATITAPDQTSMLVVQSYPNSGLAIADVLTATDEQLLASGSFTLVSEEAITIGGVEGSKKLYKMEADGQTVLQCIYGVENNGTIYIGIGAAQDETSLGVVENILVNIQYK